ncbi:MAG: tetratricopeptide repeat protein [Planctomycetes bacterium]|nr:tetratricopeptide repeat protein [Planctomycetota bacterium]
MERRTNGRAWCLCLALLALGLPGWARGQQLDAVYESRGTTAYGTIGEITRTTVTLETNQGKKLYPVNEIRKIAFSGEPGELRSARDSIPRGQIEDARSALEKISMEAVQRKEIRQDIEFLKAFCDGRMALTGGGDKIAAVRAMVAFVEDAANQNSYHYFTGVELLGDLAVALGRYENAVKYYARLGEAPWPEFQIRASVLGANALVANRQFAEAQAKYEQVLAAGVDDVRAREQKQLATVGRAVCLAETGKPDEGIVILEAVIAENDSTQKHELFARTYNALGVSYVRAGKTQDALLAFLHVDLMFNQNPDAHAEALYHLSTLWRAVNDADRANRARSLLQSRYSGSPWADKK